MNTPLIKACSISADIKIGSRVVIIEPSNVYGCEIHDDVFIGPFVEIQRNSVIGRGSKIQSHSFICELVEIGEFCFIAHGVMFINDLFASGAPAGGVQEKWKHTKIGNNVSIGSNATILPVTICNNVVIGAGSVVTADICKPGIYAGNPARFLRSFKQEVN